MALHLLETNLHSSTATHLTLLLTSGDILVSELENIEIRGESVVVKTPSHPTWSSIKLEGQLIRGISCFSLDPVGASPVDLLSISNRLVSDLVSKGHCEGTRRSNQHAISVLEDTAVEDICFRSTAILYANMALFKSQSWRLKGIDASLSFLIFGLGISLEQSGTEDVTRQAVNRLKGNLSDGWLNEKKDGDTLGEGYISLIMRKGRPATFTSTGMNNLDPAVIILFTPTRVSDESPSNVLKKGLIGVIEQKNILFPFELWEKIAQPIRFCGKTSHAELKVGQVIKSEYLLVEVIGRP